MTTYVYVDGFNLYFGSLLGTPYKWLDIDALATRLLRPENQIMKIKYFTARINARPGDPDQPMRQLTYLRALQTFPHLEIFFGHFLTHVVRMPLANPAPGQNLHAKVIRTSEKGSDVNIATQLMHDAHRGAFDCAVIISGDSDLLMPVRLVINDLKKPVGVINPQKTPCRVLETTATFYKHIRPAALAASQLPPTLTDSRGTFSKPMAW